MNKIVIISPHNTFPPMNGGERRIYLLTKSLSKKNRVLFLGPVLKDKSQVDLPIEVYGAFLDKPKNKFLNIKLIKKLKDILKNDKETPIQLEFPWQGINLILLQKHYTLDEHNVEFLRFKQAGSLIWPLVYLYELLVCKFASNIICVSEIDKRYLIKYFKINPHKIEIIENPVDASVFYPNTKNNKKIRTNLGLRDNEKMILFFGQLNYQPNVESLEIIKTEIIPRLEKRGTKYKLVICGSGDGKGLLKNYSHKSLIFKGFVDKIADYINASSVVIVPLKSGSGTRLKILETLSCKKRVISTSIGAEGIKKNKFLEIEDDWEKFVEKI